MARRDFPVDRSAASLYQSLAVPTRCAAERPFETVNTRQQETIDNDRAFDLLIDTGAGLWGPGG